MSTTPTPLAVQTIADALTQLRTGQLGTSRFSDICRAQAPHLHGLPAAYSEVLLGLLDRLEAGSLFAEESCSFSQTDLHDSLQMWVDKAKAASDKTA